MMSRIEIEIVSFLILAAIGVISYFKLWPSVDSIHGIADLLNTKGGIILVLWATSIFFFVVGIRFMGWTISLIVDGKLNSDNAAAISLVNGAINWISGAAFMGAFGAMLNAMKGEPAAKSGTAETTVVTTSSAPTEKPKE
jgi:hypothetical protein